MHERPDLSGNRVAVGVFASRWVFAVVAAAVIGSAGLRGAAAQDFGATPIKPVPPADLAKTPSSAPLQGVMRLNPSKFGARAAGAPAVSGQSIQDACLAVGKNRYAQSLRDIQNKESLCAAASYSVADQRAASCTRADTDDQCQVRLFAYCKGRGSDLAAFRTAANEELATARRARDMLEGHIRSVENALALRSGDVGLPHSPPQLPRLETVPIR